MTDIAYHALLGLLIGGSLPLGVIATQAIWREFQQEGGLILAGGVAIAAAIGATTGTAIALLRLYVW